MRIDDGVARCQCGKALELRCPDGHDPDAEPRPLRVHDAVDRVARDTKAPRKNAREPKRQDVPLEHPPALREKSRRRWQAKHDRRCACGAMFTPTGPRDTRCPTCKG